MKKIDLIDILKQLAKQREEERITGGSLTAAEGEDSIDRRRRRLSLWWKGDEERRGEEERVAEGGKGRPGHHLRRGTHAAKKRETPFLLIEEFIYLFIANKN